MTTKKERKCASCGHPKDLHRPQSIPKPGTEQYNKEVWKCLSKSPLSIALGKPHCGCELFIDYKELDKTNLRDPRHMDKANIYHCQVICSKCHHQCSNHHLNYCLLGQDKKVLCHCRKGLFQDSFMTTEELWEKWERERDLRMKAERHAGS